MKKSIRSLIAGCTLACSAVSASLVHAADPLTLQLKWVTQAQFAGYYVALEKGFYEEEDLDMTIKPGGPDIAPPQVIAGGGADVIVEWMPAALASREKGLPLVNIGQVFNKSGMMLTCLKSSGIEKPMDVKGKTLGVWFFGNEYPFLAWMSKLGLPTDGSEGGVTVLKQGFNVDPIFQGQADCVSTMVYNEYGQVLDGGLTPEELTVFSYQDQGVAMLEDGLYTTEAKLKDPAMVDKLARFLKASVKGWEWAAKYPEEAAEIVLEYDDTGAQTLEHQVRMAKAVAQLIAGNPQGVGYLDPAAYERTVDVLMSGESAPVITKKPTGAWTHDVYEKAGL
ncbi:ABC transporter substrate-binding protein [Marinomonas mediterranea]|jgi:ABC-type nitrate/sulfonate/bicarbonate transport systems, periplasmic components|uniref:Thiamine pyrimidine synthase n=1 Tax=Marinomonas mediterranea (strain ATCC 700492 / JCM 21426 / NBRC 103028 / MMB-1) TaxID=717774 RepID=F2JWG9_MARM1|nr:ABC transporter substrate-binding protein [Marinomonas mediterranea]ADZ90642.1 NMT1/THI5-like domain-containing protein [Marinomonas mediterranea MMB-1]WCN08684.1 ABC transporter substrate-binding protein [Marinomonas mediterranea]WCN12738.1 ABC transporter substrate-binding protein [Marinomonas mediterranea]WCN16812.1 ABC transporter substrate-binding protein [Marinomonas mediterranea MMB-1]